MAKRHMLCGAKYPSGGANITGEGSLDQHLKDTTGRGVRKLQEAIINKRPPPHHRQERDVVGK